MDKMIGPMVLKYPMNDIVPSPRQKASGLREHIFAQRTPGHARGNPMRRADWHAAGNDVMQVIHGQRDSDGRHSDGKPTPTLLVASCPFRLPRQLCTLASVDQLRAHVVKYSVSSHINLVIFIIPTRMSRSGPGILTCLLHTAPVDLQGPAFSDGQDLFIRNSSTAIPMHSTIALILTTSSRHPHD
jgi:hypothetical protein